MAQADNDLFHDVLILGAGAGGLSVALELPAEARVAVLSKGQLDQGATNWAQGGIAAAIDPGDSFESHIEDTMIAGAGLNSRDTVRFVVERAPGIIEWLETLGIDMAWRAGCRIADMEFTQFHPTCLAAPDGQTFLISEAVRGEGGRLLLPDGTRFMDRFHPRGELAPRDVVARAIDHEMKRLGIPHVLLDIAHKGEGFVREHFPTLHAHCLTLGYDLAKEPVPVVPAAHYTCGGVMTDVHGRTDLDGLYAVGECAFTGLHGANRLASNSLLECLVIGREAGREIGHRLSEFAEPTGIPGWDESWVRDSDEEVVLTHNWDELRRFMWDYVGIVRTTKRLERALHRCELLESEIHEYYANFRVSRPLLELRNMACVAGLIVRSALARHESRGLHYTLDYPAPQDAECVDTILTPAPVAPDRAAKPGRL